MPTLMKFLWNTWMIIEKVTYVCVLSCIRLFTSPWTVDCQDPLSMEFSRQGYWSGLPFPSPGILPTQGLNPESLALAGVFFTTCATWKPLTKNPLKEPASITNLFQICKLFWKFNSVCFYNLKYSNTSKEVYLWSWVVRTASDHLSSCNKAETEFHLIRNNRCLL